MTAKLNLIVAHTLESKPLIELFALRQCHANPAVYGNTDGLRLIVSGESQHCAIAAVNYLYGNLYGDARLHGSVRETADQAWLNIGIAGHQSAPIGQSLLINKLVNRRTAEVIYPVPLFPGYAAGELHTVDEPEQDYPDNVAYDMEAFGFFTAAIPCTTLELVQSLKLISDNRQQGTDSITRERVLAVFSENRVTLSSLVSDMLEQQESYRRSLLHCRETISLFAAVHLTATQRAQVNRLCQRYCAFGLQEELQALKVTGFSGRQLVSHLQAGLKDVEAPV